MNSSLPASESKNLFRWRVADPQLNFLLALISSSLKVSWPSLIVPHQSADSA
jgi:hypothetical protein